MSDQAFNKWFEQESANAKKCCDDCYRRFVNVEVSLKRVWDARSASFGEGPELDVVRALELCLEHAMLGTLMVDGKDINLTEVVEQALAKAGKR